MSWSTVNFVTLLEPTSISGLPSAIIYGSYASSDIHLRRKLHTRLSGPSCIPELNCNGLLAAVSEVPARKVYSVSSVPPPVLVCAAVRIVHLCTDIMCRQCALARDARSHQVQTVHARVQVPPRTRTSVPVGPLHACHGAHSPQIICDTWKISVSPPDENQDDRSARILFRIVCCLECTSSAPARPWSLAEQFQD